ncbi:MAG: dephospho-CoA kinase [Candidatus Marinimicrobia bacterium]|jgi:dephospho-CoA kinase|nr:dephospho-CoA kinase [Candidatus Neomarinimicrobiota bacterium]MDP6853279.1 dephospho-CoA kinase [Candidatus Neomarinimicrobiota bacterium]MDP6936216.1 dephospho-CoA kinase [Candidatus Neomarinimicrobiota bacterium]
MYRLGITGGIGSGKSTAASFFKSKGAFIVDADDEAKKLIINSDQLQSSIIGEFGENVTHQGSLDLLLLSKIAFSSPAKQQMLNALVWPSVGDFIKQKEDEARKGRFTLFIVEAALLLEAEFENFFDSILLITADSAIRKQRVTLRKNIPEKQIEQRMALQMPESDKEKRADYIIRNNNDRKSLLEELEIYYLTLPI